MLGRLFRRVPLLLLLPPLAGLVWTLLIGWPGAISADMAGTIREGAAFRFWGHQEPMAGLVWSLVLALCSLPTAVGVFYITQSLAYWLAFALFVHGALRTKSFVAAAMASVGGFLPPLLCFTVMVESNLQVGAAWTLAIAIAACVRSRWAGLGICFLLYYGFCARAGMIVAIPAVLFACLRLRSPAASLWRIALWSLLGSVAFAGVSFTITTLLLGSPSRHNVLGVSQLFDMAGIYEQTGKHQIPPALVPAGATAEQVLAQYDPAVCSTLFWRSDDKPVFRLPKDKEEGAVLRQAWMQTIQQHPAAYFAIKLRYAGLFLMVGVEWAKGFWPDDGANKSLDLAVPEGAGWTALRDYGSTTGTWLVWKGWFWLSITGLACLVAAGLRLERRAPAVALYLGAICSMVPQFVFGQAALARYYFLPYVLCTCCLLLLAGSFGAWAWAKVLRRPPVAVA